MSNLDEVLHSAQQMVNEHRHAYPPVWHDDATRIIEQARAELAALRQERDDWKQRAEQRAEAIQYAIEYLKETHPERVKYPEYIEFHVCNSLAIAIMPERVDGEK